MNLFVVSLLQIDIGEKNDSKNERQWRSSKEGERGIRSAVYFCLKFSSSTWNYLWKFLVNCETSIQFEHYHVQRQSGAKKSLVTKNEEFYGIFRYFLRFE